MGKKWTGERIMKAILDVLLVGESFVDNVRPRWLRTPQGSYLELDRYYPRLKLAFEFQGEQHYTVVADFHNQQNELFAQQHRDHMKQDLCTRKAIRLLYVNRANLSVQTLLEHCHHYLFGNVFRRLQPIWNDNAGKFTTLDVLAEKYRNKKPSGKKAAPEVLLEGGFPLNAIRKPTAELQKAQPYWQDANGILVYSPSAVYQPGYLWVCGLCNSTCVRPRSVLVVYCGRCAKKNVASKMTCDSRPPIQRQNRYVNAAREEAYNRAVAIDAEMRAKRQRRQDKAQRELAAKK